MAVTLTVVVPIGNTEPDIGLVVTVTAPPQLSEAVGSGNVTAIEVAFVLGGRVSATLAIGLITGGVVSAVTLTVRLAVPIAPSALVTFSPTKLLPSAALQAADKLALIVPPVLVIFITEIPAGMLVVETVRLSEVLSTSITVAIVETVPGAPRWRETVVGLIVGASLTGVTIIVKLTGADVSTPPFAVPPLSFRTAVMVALPEAFAAGANESVPSAAIVGATPNNAGLVLLVTVKASV